MDKNLFFVDFFCKLQNSKIGYAVLRNYKDLPNSTGGSDLDIWVERTQYNDFIDILSEISCKHKGQLVSALLDDPLCPRLIYLGENWGCQFDIHVGVATHRGVTYIPNNLILENIINYNGIKVLSQELDSFISFLKEILNNKTCRIDYCTRAADLVSHLSDSKRNEYLLAFSPKIRHAIVDLLLKRDFSEKSIAALGMMASNDLLSCYDKVKYRFKQLPKLLRLFRQPGYTICVLGTDGSGKSFIINSLRPVLNDAFHKGIHYEHMRPNLLPSIAVLTGRKQKNEKTEVCSNPHGSKPSSFLGSLFRITYYWFDYTYGYFRKVFLDKSIKTHVWIFDRYYYDYIFDPLRGRISLPEWILKTYGVFIPVPDLILCLGGDPKKIYERKPETSLEEVIRQTNELRAFCNGNKKAVWIDTTVPPEQSISNAMNAILEMMKKRFSHVNLKDF